ncbi:MAG TPA: DUF4845 domain-containing protein [Arenimonas sp.]|uniref:DUF4845 domain-containing protein n=1 Tax=Arenimonas sp. TaxID=1872635 RepID=UPI002C990387|nr:DUF4845 domain-containing protein [Arenimonas sp.]HMB57041.1 DUF4845 domain-containing protein [Arenimonas sp.]
MDKKQRGITLMGFIMILILVMVFVGVGMQLVPVYSEYYSVKAAMDSVVKEGLDTDITDVQRKISKHFNTDYVNSVDQKQIVFAPASGNKKLMVHYEVRKPLMGNVEFLVTFDYTTN